MTASSGKKTHELSHACNSKQSKQPQHIHVNGQIVGAQDSEDPGFQYHHHDEEAVENKPTIPEASLFLLVG
jgi:hypothetical protein